MSTGLKPRRFESHDPIGLDQCPERVLQMSIPVFLKSNVSKPKAFESAV